MISLYNSSSIACSKVIMEHYSTSFSLGTRILHNRFREPVWAIYGFVRLADEIVDTFHEHDKAKLLAELRRDTYQALADGISINPVIHAFQHTVGQYNIDHTLIDAFLKSMEMDLTRQEYDTALYNTYIYGSAEVVGLMCLTIFCEGDHTLYNRLVPPARSLGAAFQKINFLRDMKSDHIDLNRQYFPGMDLNHFDKRAKRLIEEEIAAELDEAMAGIRQLPVDARLGVYLSYRYYLSLFRRIRHSSPHRLMVERIRVPAYAKLYLFVQSYLQNSLNMI